MRPPSIHGIDVQEAGLNWPLKGEPVNEDCSVYVHNFEVLIVQIDLYQM